MIPEVEAKETAMSAMYQVEFEDGTSVLVHSADARSPKRRDVRSALQKARLKAKARRKRDGRPRTRVTSVRCVG